MNVQHETRRIAGALLLAACASASAAEYPSTVLAQDPVGYWRLNETTQPPVLPISALNSGSAGPSANGELISVTRGLPGALQGEASNLAYQMPGVEGNRVRIPYRPEWNQGPFSVEFWAKPASTTAFVCPAASVEFIPSPTYRNGWLFYQTGQGWSFRMYQGTSGTALAEAATNMPLSTSEWYHIVGVSDGLNNLKLYVNGALVANTNSAGQLRANTNSNIPLTFGARADGVSGYFPYLGDIDEPAVYNKVLTDAQVLAHYQAGTNASGNYAQVIQADAPLGWWRFNEPGDPPAANVGSYGADVMGRYVYPAQPGVAGPTTAGFEANNKAVNFPGNGGFVSVPALYLDTNTVTMSGWLKLNGAQGPLSRIIFSEGGSTAAGLIIDQEGGTAISYNWNNDISTYGWKTEVNLPENVWAYVALVIQPDRAAIYVGNPASPGNFIGVTNYTVHANQLFESDTLFGANPANTNYLNGAVDEVAIFDRALGAGEVYSQFAAAIGGVAARIFADPAAPMDTVYVGDALTLSVDAGGTPPITYQWRKGGTAISGATNNTFAIASLASGDAGNYDVVVKSATGAEVTSQAAAVAVNPLTVPAISSEPVGRTLYAGGTLTLGVTATGGRLAYQWKKDGTDIAGATNATYTVGSVAADDAGSYQLTVTNPMGNSSTTPVNVTVAVPPAGSYEALIVSHQPEAWFRLNEASGATTLFDAMGRHDGYYTNLSGAPVTLGVPGALLNNTDTAASFDGTSESWGVVPYSPALNTPDFTMEAWVKTTSDTDGMTAVSSRYAKRGGWIRTDTGNPSGWGAGVSDDETDYRVPTDAAPGAKDRGWSHVVLTFGAGESMRVYVNGEWDGAAYVDFDRNGAGPVIIGARGQSGSVLPDELFNGQVDEVAFYATNLTGEQILAHYNARYGASTAPVFAVQPDAVFAVPGQDASLKARVEGSTPISYQWYKDGAAVTDATNSFIDFRSIQFTEGGTYYLRATNSAGATNSASVAVLVIPPPQFVSATNDLVMHFKFEGNYNDASGRGNNGTAQGSPRFLPGVSGQAVQVSTGVEGSTVTNANYISLGQPSVLKFKNVNAFSVGYWIKLPTNSVPGDLPIIGSARNSANNTGFTFAPSYQEGGWQWNLNDGTKNFDVNGPEGSINDGQWHHLLFTFDRTAAVGTAYLDGVKVRTTSIAGLGDFDTASDINIGQDPTGTYPENGIYDLDDFAVWHRVLTPLEAFTLYQAGMAAGAGIGSTGVSSIGIAPAGDQLVIVWSAGILVESTSVNGPWTPVAGATAPTFRVTPTAGNRFYRVQQ